MIARKVSEYERGGGLHAPAFEILAAHFLVLQPTESSDRKPKRRLILIFVNLQQLEISAQRRQHQLQQLIILEHLARRAVQTPEHVEKFRFGKIKRDRMRILDLRRG